MPGAPSSSKGFEALIVEQFIYESLHNDATLLASLGGNRIYSYTAPENTLFPYIVFSSQSNQDIGTHNASRVMSNFLYLVKVVGKTRSFSDLRAVADRLDFLLEGQVNRPVGPQPGGMIHSCVREQTIPYGETDTGVEYRHLAGLYRIYVQNLS